MPFAGERLVQSFAASRLAVVTRDATALRPDLASAPLWGLLRSAQSENPDRFVLVDLDGSESSVGRLADALASAEPELAIREGAVLVPRLTRATMSEVDAAPWAVMVSNHGHLLVLVM